MTTAPAFAARAVENTRIAAALADATGDRRDELVEELTVLNMDVARVIARRLARREDCLADVEQVAHLALFRAAGRFDPQRGEHFLPYAVASIRGAVRHYHRDESWMIRPTRPVQEHHHELRRGGLGLVKDGLAIETCHRPLSLDLPHDSADFTPIARLRSADAAAELVELREVLRPALATLAPRARTVIWLRFILDRTQQEIGDLLGLSQVQVSRLIARHLAELRSVIEAAA